MATTASAARCAHFESSICSSPLRHGSTRAGIFSAMFDILFMQLWMKSCRRCHLKYTWNSRMTAVEFRSSASISISSSFTSWVGCESSDRIQNAGRYDRSRSGRRAARGRHWRRANREISGEALLITRTRCPPSFFCISIGACSWTSAAVADSTTAWDGARSRGSRLFKTSSKSPVGGASEGAAQKHLVYRVTSAIPASCAALSNKVR
mmetsp:Transcript_88588/g.236814  ORF Transcript_88588/g.236814 Transcript_88588/m.236814 type:complete len:208 (+) Transcript_88588:1078-1701(+)